MNAESTIQEPVQIKNKKERVKIEENRLDETIFQDSTWFLNLFDLSPMKKETKFQFLPIFVMKKAECSPVLSIFIPFYNVMK